MLASTKASARMYFSSPTLIFTYVSFGFTQRATFEGSVHGVVVHARKYVFSSPFTINFAVAERSLTSL